MSWLYQLKSYLGLAVLAAVIFAGAYYLPKFKFERHHKEYDDIKEVPEYGSVRYDASISMSQFDPGDLVVYRTGGEDVSRVCYGYVVGKPGDKIGIEGGKLRSNGQIVSRGRVPRSPDRAEVIVPADHVWVVSDYNQFDSFHFGPIPRTLVLGRVGG